MEGTWEFPYLDAASKKAVTQIRRANSEKLFGEAALVCELHIGLRLQHGIALFSFEARSISPLCCALQATLISWPLGGLF